MGVKLAAASGGSVELVPTNTASNFTVTVPAVTASVLTDSAGILNIGSGQVYKDASGNLMVGTTSQIGSAKLSVYSGNTNATTYTTAASTGGSSLYIQQQQTTSVSTSAVVILTPNLFGSLCLVHGSDGTNRFQDLVMFGLGTGTVNVITALAIGGTPASRTYSQSASAYRVAMGSGTYTVQVAALSMSS